MNQNVMKTWKKTFPDFSLLNCLSSSNIKTYIHSLGDRKPLLINRSLSKLPMPNNATYSYEWDGSSKDGAINYYLNTYEIIIPNLALKSQQFTSVDIYVNLLKKKGFKIDWKHYGSIENTIPICTIHHSDDGFDPIIFSEGTIAALLETMSIIEKNN